MGGPKGYGLAVVADVLAGILVGGSFKRPFSSTRGNFLTRLGHFVAALNIESFMPLTDFTGKVDRLIRDLKSSECIKGIEEILLPGERGLRTKEARLKLGIPLASPVWDELENLGKELNIGSDIE